MIQDAQRTPSRKNAKKPIPRHVFFKLQEIKDKEKFLNDGIGEKGPHLQRTMNCIQIIRDHASKRSGVKYLKW